MWLSQVREETETRIDIPPEGPDVTVFTVSGPKDHVDRAREMLESTQRGLVCATLTCFSYIQLLQMLISFSALMLLFGWQVGNCLLYTSDAADE